MKTYVLTISQTFPSTHPKKGEATLFPYQIEKGQKIHTIRKNYWLWKKRIDEVTAGMAFLSVRIWEGKPYNSKQLEIFRFDKDHGVGIEAFLYFENSSFQHVAKIEDEPVRCLTSRAVDTEVIAKADGLTKQDFNEWFKSSDPDHGAIIHFTPFRYLS